MDGWTQLDLGARYQLPVAGRLLMLCARIDNVTNANAVVGRCGERGLGDLFFR